MTNLWLDVLIIHCIHCNVATARLLAAVFLYTCTMVNTLDCINWHFHQVSRVPLPFPLSSDAFSNIQLGGVRRWICISLALNFFNAPAGHFKSFIYFLGQGYIDLAGLCVFLSSAGIWGVLMPCFLLATWEISFLSSPLSSCLSGPFAVGAL